MSKKIANNVTRQNKNVVKSIGQLAKIKEQFVAQIDKQIDALQTSADTLETIATELVGEPATAPAKQAKQAKPAKAEKKAPAKAEKKAHAKAEKPAKGKKAEKPAKAEKKATKPAKAEKPAKGKKAEKPAKAEKKAKKSKKPADDFDFEAE